VTLSRIHCCHWEGAIPSLFIVIDQHVGANNVQRLSVAFQSNNVFPLHWCRATKYLELLSTVSAHLIFCVNFPTFFSDFNQNWSSREIFIDAPNKSFSQKILLVEAALINAYRQKDGQS
jgi:hypothetical protein